MLDRSRSTPDPMAVFLVLLAALVLVSALHVVGDEIELSIDCGLDDKYSGYRDTNTDLTYVADGTYVDGGESHVVAAAAADQARNGRVDAVRSLRSFPSGKWNCYALPTITAATYLVRMQFLYGNYDGMGSSSVQFEIRLGSVPWDTVTVGLVDANATATATAKEAVFVAWAGWAPVCLVNTGRGTPFVSVVELRKLGRGGGLYPPVSGNLSMSMYDRRMMGTDAPVTRHPTDTHDRLWYGTSGPQWRNMSTQHDIDPDPSYDVPSPILQTAVEPAGGGNSNSTTLTVVAGKDYRNTYQFMAFLHFADFNSTQQLREFDIYVNDKPLTMSSKPYRPQYLAGSCVGSPEWYSAPDGRHNVTLVGTAASVLPPMLNALEIYTLIDLDDAPAPPTMAKDFDAIMGIKLKYAVKKNWTGDPCLPDTEWDGVTCNNTGPNNVPRIISLNLSNSNLSDDISLNFTLLTALETLDLSYNNLNGLIPDFLTSLPSLQVLNLSGNHLSGPLPESFCKDLARPLVFSYEDQVVGPPCAARTNSSRKRTIAKAVSIGVSMLAVAVLVLVYFTRRKKSHPNVRPESTHGDLAGDPEFENDVPRSAKGRVDCLQDTENRQFTYKELEKMTNDFEWFIGHGGFGRVYYGRLENGTEVAVKMRSESSLHGLDEFLAEVQSLTKVHHRNLVSLVGYCWEGDHLALVYEYLSQGSLLDHLRGKNSAGETLNWGARVRVVLEAAQGLDYLHKGCNPPIIHRDVKSSNILLGRSLEAKLADFGLCKTYLSDSQTHISATAAGTSGYIDPEYYHTGRLTESSDVYSFGVVLLEVATGKAPMLPGHGHIVQRVNQMIAAGDDISRVADARLEGAYDVNSMWKVVDTASKCASDAAAQRPTMATVVSQLKESLALEEARESETESGRVRANSGGDVSALLSAGGPSAR